MEAPDYWPLTLLVIVAHSSSLFWAFLFSPVPASPSPRVCETTSYRPFSVLFTVDCCQAGGRRPDGLEHRLALPCICCAQRLRLSGTRVLSTAILWRSPAWQEASNLYKLSLQIHGGRKNKRETAQLGSVVVVCSSFLPVSLQEQTYLREQISICIYLTLRCIRVYSFEFVFKWFDLILESKYKVPDTFVATPRKSLELRVFI